MPDELNGNSLQKLVLELDQYMEKKISIATSHNMYTHTHNTHTLRWITNLKNSLNLTFLGKYVLSFGIYKHFLEKMQNLLNKKERK